LPTASPARRSTRLSTTWSGTSSPAAQNARVDLDVQVTTKAPAYRPPKTQAKYDATAGGLVFNTECRENPDQMTLSDLDDDSK
jgi:hypothetical protein